MTPVHVAVVKNINIAMEHKRTFISGIILFALMISFSESASTQVSISEEEEVREIMQLYTQYNFTTPIVRAWRIQIITTNDRSTMERALDRFERIYPHIRYKWEHNPPYYQVRIGAYEQREELEAFLLELKEEFPAAIPVQDDIEKNEIIAYP